MRISKVKIKNFRLLADVQMALEDQTTLVVGRNNSGKTSLSELIRRFLVDNSPTFNLEDFSTASYDRFCAALRAKNEGLQGDEIRRIVPAIELRMLFRYDPTNPQLGPLSDFVIDLDPACRETQVVVRYELQEGGLDALFAGQPTEELTIETRPKFYRALRERIPTLFVTKVWAEDPNDPTNKKPVSQAAFRSLLKTGFINAQRGLDDTTSRETDVLAKILEGLFTTATSPTASASQRKIADELQEAVLGIQHSIDDDFTAKLKNLMPAFQSFGYPGLGGTRLQTETTLDVKRLLSNHTKVNYVSYDGVTLPESYNGLGMRNLIFIILQIVGFYRAYRAEPTTPGVHLVFIEEPEAHLHPQMQEVFIRQLSKIADYMNAEHPDAEPWSVQFVVSTHSSHVANEAGFESIRYFMATSTEDTGGVRQTKVKDLREGLGGTSVADRKFLHQYLTLTRCDLFFADKAVLVEGTSERLLLPVIIRKLEAAEPNLARLSSQYVTVLEVGGAYAHLFFGLLDFLELSCLLITDIDSVSTTAGTACPVHQGTGTSNACIKAWFAPGDCSLDAIMGKTQAEKIKGRMRIAYERPETPNGPCGRSFEDAFLLANQELFGINGTTSRERELVAYEKASKVKKSDFALKHAIQETDWVAPGYIVEGIKWLAGVDVAVPSPTLELVAATAEKPVHEEADQGE